MIDSKGIPEYPVSPFLFQNHLPRKDHVIRVQGAEGGTPESLNPFLETKKVVIYFPNGRFSFMIGKNQEDDFV